ncbi:hypothetical protein [Prosthecobacter sp.]|uniref:hypothetical protein n=1 Tax=Prosthecobacter sp. TaxID=1965333 RepID=UPI00378458D4
MKTASISLLTGVVLASAWPAVAQQPAETILPAIVPAGQSAVVKAEAAPIAQSKKVTAPTGVVVNPTPVRPAVNAPHATVFSENSAPKPDLTVHYYLPVGAVSPESGIRTYPGNTAAHLTNGATRSSSGIPAGSTFARLAGSNGSRSARGSTKAPTVRTP